MILSCATNIFTPHTHTLIQTIVSFSPCIIGLSFCAYITIIPSLFPSQATSVEFHLLRPPLSNMVQYGTGWLLFG